MYLDNELKIKGTGVDVLTTTDPSGSVLVSDGTEYVGGIDKNIKANSVEAAGQVASGNILGGALSAASEDDSKGTDILPESTTTSDTTAYSGQGGAIGHTATTLFSTKGAETVELTHDHMAGIIAASPAIDNTNPPIVAGSLVVKQTMATLTDASTVAVDFSLSNNFILTLTAAVGASRTLGNPTNVTVGQTGVIYLCQPVAGGLSVVFGTYYNFIGKVNPNNTTTASAVDSIVYVARSATAIDCQLMPNWGNSYV